MRLREARKLTDTRLDVLLRLAIGARGTMTIPKVKPSTTTIHAFARSTPIPFLDLTICQSFFTPQRPLMPRMGTMEPNVDRS
jgi:hypothetical protein